MARTANKAKVIVRPQNVFNKSEHDFVKSGKVEEAARKAGEGDKQEMERAQEIGKGRAKEFDPAVERDYSKPTKGGS